MEYIACDLDKPDSALLNKEADVILANATRPIMEVVIVGGIMNFVVGEEEWMGVKTGEQWCY